MDRTIANARLFSKNFWASFKNFCTLVLSTLSHVSSQLFIAQPKHSIWQHASICAGRVGADLRWSYSHWLAIRGWHWGQRYLLSKLCNGHYLSSPTHWQLGPNMPRPVCPEQALPAVNSFSLIDLTAFQNAGNVCKLTSQQLERFPNPKPPWSAQWPTINFRKIALFLH